MKNIFQGWEYINALMNILKNEQDKHLFKATTKNPRLRR